MTLAGGRASVVVIGGGLAGISAAIRLADAGLEVALLEARPWLGGATWSFARRGLTIDNGQHVFMRCCVAYRDLLARLGVGSFGPIQDELDLTVLGPDAQARVRRSLLPAPWHLARSLAGYRLLSRAERAKVAAAALALQFVDVARRDDRSLGDWLTRHGQDERARRLFWDQLSLSALNIGSERADLPMAATAIRTALLARRASADLGVPSVPLSQLHGGPAAELLRQLKVMVRLGVRVSSLRASPAGGWDIGLAYGEHAGTPHGASFRQGSLFEHGPARINAAGVVLAVPAWEAAIVAPDSLAGDAALWAQLDPSPVMSIHVIYGSRVTQLPFAATADSPVHWVMDKTTPAGLHAGQYLAASVRAADGYLDMPVAQLRAEFLPAMARLFPAAAEAKVEDFFVTRERRATIAHVPGSQRLRLVPAGPVGFALAGAWTDTGWPDTMEGAVRSGQVAAQKLIAELPAQGGVPARATVAARTVPASTVSANNFSAGTGPPAPAPAHAAPASTASASKAPVRIGSRAPSPVDPAPAGGPEGVEGQVATEGRESSGGSESTGGPESIGGPVTAVTELPAAAQQMSGAASATADVPVVAPTAATQAVSSSA